MLLWFDISREGAIKFGVAAEARDNLVSAGQNLLAAHQNLYEHVSLPYCTLDEINTLNKVILNCADFSVVIYIIIPSFIFLGNNIHFHRYAIKIQASACRTVL